MKRIERKRARKLKKYRALKKHYEFEDNLEIAKGLAYVAIEGYLLGKRVKTENGYITDPLTKKDLRDVYIGVKNSLIFDDGMSIDKTFIMEVLDD